MIVPRWAYGYIAIVASAPLLWALHMQRLTDARIRGEGAGRDAVTAAASRAIDEAAASKIAAELQRDSAVARTEDASRSTDYAVARAHALARKLAAAVDTVTVVDTVRVIVEQLVAATDSVVVTVDSLRAALEAERSAHLREIVTWRDADRASRVRSSQLELRVVKAEQRPGWRGVAVGAVVGVATGYLIERVR